MALQAEYAAHLAGGETSLVRCFLLRRRDGLEFAATEHDRDVVSGGVTFKASTAMTATDAAASLGLAADELEAHGALSSEAITEADILAGLYDGAQVEVWDISFRQPEIRQLLGVYSLGEIARGATAFRAELRSRTAALAQKQGRAFLALCDATLGDERCGINLDAPENLGVGTVVRQEGLTVYVAGIEAFPEGHFDRGRATWTEGGNAGLVSEVRVSIVTARPAALKLWRAPPHPIEVGTAFEVRAGCNRTFEQCGARFGNALRFRGFPHMTGETFLTEYARTGDASQDGGSRQA